MKTVTTVGRGYPNPLAAEAALRRALARDGITPRRVWTRRWTSQQVFCPFEALAEIEDDEFAGIQYRGEKIG